LGLGCNNQCNGNHSTTVRDSSSGHPRKHIYHYNNDGAYTKREAVDFSSNSQHYDKDMVGDYLSNASPTSSSFQRHVAGNGAVTARLDAEPD
jgi:hypothetical protein